MGTDSSATSEEALLPAARAGDAQAFGELTERHRSACLKRAMLMIRNRTAAEDEVQNAFWKAFQHLEQFRGEGTFPAWLSRIVENQCLMRIREERNSRFVYLDQSTESNVRMELVGQLSSPEDQLGLNEVVNLLRTEISRIPPLLRNVMLLRDLDQLSMPEVAFRLGLSVPAAKSRLMRARMELRSRVDRALCTQGRRHANTGGAVLPGSLHPGKLSWSQSVQLFSSALRAATAARTPLSLRITFPMRANVAFIHRIELGRNRTDSPEAEAMTYRSYRKKLSKKL